MKVFLIKINGTADDEKSMRRSATVTENITGCHAEHVCIQCATWQNSVHQKLLLVIKKQTISSLYFKVLNSARVE